MCIVDEFNTVISSPVSANTASQIFATKTNKNWRNNCLITHKYCYLQLQHFLGLFAIAIDQIVLLWKIEFTIHTLAAFLLSAPFPDSYSRHSHLGVSTCTIFIPPNEHDGAPDFLSLNVFDAPKPVVSCIKLTNSCSQLPARCLSYSPAHNCCNSKSFIPFHRSSDQVLISYPVKGNC